VLVMYHTVRTAEVEGNSVVNTAEHIILANTEVWWSRASPGGGTYGVLISNDFPLAISASLSGLRRCDQIVAVARVTANKKTSGLLIFVSRKASHRGTRFRKCGRQKTADNPFRFGRGFDLNNDRLFTRHREYRN